MSIHLSICAYHNGPIEWDGERWVDTRSGDDGGTFDWCPDSPNITDAEPLQPHKERTPNYA